MNKDQCLEDIHKKFDVLATVDLDDIVRGSFYQRRMKLINLLQDLYKPRYLDNQRLVFTQSQYDESMLTMLQQTLNSVDISNFFCILLLGGGKSIAAKDIMQKISSDAVPVTVLDYEIAREYQYNSSDPLKINIDSLPESQQSLLTKSKTFCIYPWMHLHVYPTGEAWPCCFGDMAAGPVGNSRKNTMQEIWNSDRMKGLRINMLQETPDPLCVRCYEQESSGFFSGRQSANKHHGHHISRVNETQIDGHLDRFQMTYWDVRFSNLCNLSCRSCGHIFSSSWYQDQVKIAGEDWAKRNKVLNIAGRDPTDMWNQLLPHMDYVEQIYFAGGEPLMMDEHYRILEELERRGRFDVRLIYNTNFTQVRLKDRLVFDYWRKFQNVAVGASLDAMGARAEYIRRGTVWDIIVRNREKMLELCPDVDFYVSSTLSIMNAWHLPDFQRTWVDRGLIKPQDFNVNILQDPPHYRIDIAPMKYKQRLRIKFEEHIDWLKPLDKLQRATVGFESSIKFMMSNDNSNLLPTFWKKSQQLDEIRGESLLESIPELEALKCS